MSSPYKENFIMILKQKNFVPQYFKGQVSTNFSENMHIFMMTLTLRQHLHKPGLIFNPGQTRIGGYVYTNLGSNQFLSTRIIISQPGLA